MEWADYCISHVNFDVTGKTIENVLAHTFHGTYLGEEMLKSRTWLVSQINMGKTFCAVTKNDKGLWINKGPFILTASGFNCGIKLPTNSVQHKTFISYYHHDDQGYRVKFENLFGDLFINKSVEDGDIDSDNSAEYIKQLIQKDYLQDTTVLVVLIGPNTKHRKHIDWEISGALDYRVGDKYTGLIGILLPSHPDYGKSTYNPANLPKRLAANAGNKYAAICDWTEDRAQMQKLIQAAFEKRTNDAEKITNKAIPQMQRNTNS